ncbi:hypothetical protein VP01_1240g4 [Puccinia sorghi]|uniref:Uncharacterized protein n=1 Tax=Puccinia sorghi TaxID=27349 RepID=A0A0L6VPL7_9BASI|nr:hypothetical protein VP01_1240g4 [Puccinia sorghi]
MIQIPRPCLTSDFSEGAIELRFFCLTCMKLKLMDFFHQVEGFFVISLRHPQSTIFKKGGSSLGCEFLEMIASTEEKYTVSSSLSTIRFDFYISYISLCLNDTEVASGNKLCCAWPYNDLEWKLKELGLKLHEGPARGIMACLATK